MFFTRVKQLCSPDAAPDLFLGIGTPQTLGTSKSFLPLRPERYMLSLFDFIAGGAHKVKKLVPISRLDNTAVYVLTEKIFPTVLLFRYKRFIV